MSYAPLQGIPKKGTKVRTVLDYFHEVGIGTAEIARKELGDEMSKETIRAAINRLRDGLLLTSCAGGLRLSVATKSMLDSEKAQADASSLVPPRHVNVMTGPQLHPSKFLNPKGTREGSDWSQFPSRQL